MYEARLRGSIRILFVRNAPGFYNLRFACRAVIMETITHQTDALQLHVLSLLV